MTFTSGVGKATINGKDQDVKAGDLMVVPAGTQHQFVNTGPTPLVCFTNFLILVLQQLQLSCTDNEYYSSYPRPRLSIQTVKQTC